MLGAICDIVATNVLAISFLFFVMMRYDLLHGKNPVPGTITALIHEHPLLYAVQILIGVSCSVFGGYIAGRLTKHGELLNGLLSSFLCVGSGVYSLIAAKGA